MIPIILPWVMRMMVVASWDEILGENDNCSLVG